MDLNAPFAQRECAMLDNVTPGSRIHVKVVKRPTSAAAAKTLVRLLSKDRAVMRENERLRKTRRHTESQHQRGGRLWTVRIVKQRPVAGKIGESGSIIASLDVLKDLKSVAKFVEVTAA
jgi:hypothetical protein